MCWLPFPSGPETVSGRWRAVTRHSSSVAAAGPPPPDLGITPSTARAYCPSIRSLLGVEVVLTPHLYVDPTLLLDPRIPESLHYSQNCLNAYPSVSFFCPCLLYRARRVINILRYCIHKNRVRKSSVQNFKIFERAPLCIYNKQF